jgi:hypothetical protein
LSGGVVDELRSFEVEIHVKVIQEDIRDGRKFNGNRVVSDC